MKNETNPNIDEHYSNNQLYMETLELIEKHKYENGQRYTSDDLYEHEKSGCMTPADKDLNKITNLRKKVNEKGIGSMTPKNNYPTQSSNSFKML